MSVVFSTPNGWFLSHLDFLEDIYTNGKDSGGKSPTCNSNSRMTWNLNSFSHMFDIQSPFLKDEQFVKLKAQALDPNCVEYSKSRKRKKSTTGTNSEVMEIKIAFDKFLTDMKAPNSNSSNVPTSKSTLPSLNSSPPRSSSVLSTSSSVQSHFNSILSTLPSTLSTANSSQPISNSVLSSLNSIVPTLLLHPILPFSPSPPVNCAPTPFPSIYLAANNNQSARKQCCQVYELIREYFDLREVKSQEKMLGAFSEEMTPFEDENDTDSVVVKDIRNPNSGVTSRFLLPPRCQFYNWDIRHLELQPKRLGRFDCVLLDPPWTNKFITRKKRQRVTSSSSWYNTMKNTSFLSEIPMPMLLKANGLVAVWCTNNKSHINQLIHEIFSVWRLKHIATWYWIKVTKYNDPVLEFMPWEHSKQPYERLIFGVPASSLNTDHLGTVNSTVSGQTENIVRDTDPEVLKQDPANLEGVQLSSTANVEDVTQRFSNESKDLKHNPANLEGVQPSSTANVENVSQRFSNGSEVLKHNPANLEDVKQSITANLENVKQSTIHDLEDVKQSTTNNLKDVKQNLICDNKERLAGNFEKNDANTSKDGPVNVARRLPENGKIIVSVPSAVHSQKPPLAGVLASYLPADPVCLELFARALTPGWVALGNQVLAFQFEELYR